jgi:hypothetical protein
MKAGGAVREGIKRLSALLEGQDSFNGRVRASMAKELRKRGGDEVDEYTKQHRRYDTQSPICAILGLDTMPVCYLTARYTKQQGPCTFHRQRVTMPLLQGSFARREPGRACEDGRAQGWCPPHPPSSPCPLDCNRYPPAEADSGRGTAAPTAGLSDAPLGPCRSARGGIGSPTTARRRLASWSPDAHVHALPVGPLVSATAAGKMPAGRGGGRGTP